MTTARLALGVVVAAGVSGACLRGYDAGLGCVDPLCLAQAPTSGTAFLALGHRVVSLLAAVTVVVASVGHLRRRTAVGASVASLAGLLAVALLGVWSHDSLLTPMATGLHLAASLALTTSVAAMAFPLVLRGRRTASLAGVAAVLWGAGGFAVGAGAFAVCDGWPWCVADVGPVGAVAVTTRVIWWSAAAGAAFLAWRAGRPSGPAHAASTAPHIGLRLAGLVVAADLAVSFAPVAELVVAQVLALHLVAAAGVWLFSLSATPTPVRRPASSSSPAPASGAGAPTP